MQALEEEGQGVEVVWRAFELRPEPVPTLDPKGEYLRRAWAQSVYPLAARLGVPMRLPPLQPRSRLAHEAAHWARAQGRFGAFHAAVFRAFFERGDDIGDLDVLASVADGAGLAGAELRRSLESGEFRLGVLEDEAEAKAMGVTGVPAFVAARRESLAGVQPVGELRRLVQGVRGSG